MRPQSTFTWPGCVGLVCTAVKAELPTVPAKRVADIAPADLTDNNTDAVAVALDRQRTLLNDLLRRRLTVSEVNLPLEDCGVLRVWYDSLRTGCRWQHKEEERAKER